MLTWYALLTECFENFEYKNQFFANPKVFLAQIPNILLDRQGALQTLFRNREDVLFLKLERQLLNYYRTEEITPEQDVMLTFIVGGATRAMQILSREGKYDAAFLADRIGEMIETISQ